MDPNSLRLLFLATVTAALAGCRTTALPQFFGPGTERQQQDRAVRFDPYPETDVGPQVVGVRPREYERPLPEVTRSRWVKPAPSPTYPFATPPQVNYAGPASGYPTPPAASFPTSPATAAPSAGLPPGATPY